MPADEEPERRSASELTAAVAEYGDSVKRKLSAVTSGSPEDQLRAPLERLVAAIASACGLDNRLLTLVGETRLGELRIRPDYAVVYRGALIGYIELKSPGKGADPRRFKSSHDKDQAKKLQALPNLLYSDGGSFSLWRDGVLVGRVQDLDGDIEAAGRRLAPSPGLLGMFDDFLSWQPIPPRTAKQLAGSSARLCRLLRDEVTEQLEEGAAPLTSLAEDWRHVLFPDASNAEFADGYAQAVTFGLLLARARGIDLAEGISTVAQRLGATNSLIGRALSLLTDTAVAQGTLATSVSTLLRVLNVVDWSTLSKGEPEAWLYFYEHFLESYDPALRRRTGSYYTPTPVVEVMTGWTDDALVHYLARPAGLADDSVVVVDPAMGTATFLLEVLRRIGVRIAEDQGEGAVGPVVTAALRRIIGFEIQLGPYAVAQLRLLAELASFGAPAESAQLRTYATDTLSNPYVEDDEYLGNWYEPIAVSRREANKVKRDEPVLVVLGNPPYKEKARHQGGWIESGTQGMSALEAFMPPRAWGLGAHVKHLYNLYVYFWRWATWKVFDLHRNGGQGVICYITVAGFLNGPGFQQMRAALRRDADRIWVVDCSPEGHQSPASTRIFQGVQHPVCIVLAVRDGSTAPDQPARVLYRQLGSGHRDGKFAELRAITLEGHGWSTCSSDWRAPFTATSRDAWASYPGLDELFAYSGSGMMPGRTWVIAPDAETLGKRWTRLVSTADTERKRALFVEHARDRTLETRLTDNLAGYPAPRAPIGDESGPAPEPVRIGYRSFDRQWVIPDKRLINRPNPTLWGVRSDRQIYLTALSRTAPTTGPAITFSALVPDLDHYDGRGGRAYPLWRDAPATQSNFRPGLLEEIDERLGCHVSPEELFAYVAAVAAHPAYTKRFLDDLRAPGIRIPMTADSELFDRAALLGSRVLWIHSYGQRFHDPSDHRPRGAPRAPTEIASRVLGSAPIPSSSADMPNALDHDATRSELRVGTGRITNVTAAMRAYQVSGVNVLDKWFSYRRRDRDRPVIGNRRVSDLSKIQPDTWLPEYTSDLIDLLHVLRLLVELEPAQATLLEEIVAGPLMTTEEVQRATHSGRSAVAYGETDVFPTLFDPPAAGTTRRLDVND